VRLGDFHGDKGCALGIHFAEARNWAADSVSGWRSTPRIDAMSSRFFVSCEGEFDFSQVRISGASTGEARIKGEMGQVTPCGG
jgi:hypothetical protein